LAKAKGGKFLSPVYQSARIRYPWRCSSGHRWMAPVSRIKNEKKWCPVCGAKRRGVGKRFPIEKIHALAKAKGGKFLSATYRSINIKYPWRCANGHTWKAPVGVIKRGQWCPYCSDGSGEESTRVCFQKIFRRRFPKKRPEWLEVGGRGARLELDGYNARMGVAFEYQGQQHYRQIPFFFKNKSSFARRILLDRRKSRLCRQHGVKLVEIPQMGGDFMLEDLLPEVIRRCRRLGIRVPAKAHRLRINYAPAWNMRRERAKKAIRDLKAFARKRGGICLDSEWRGVSSRYRFRCRRGHTWSALPGWGNWCDKCRIAQHSPKKRRWWRSNAGKRFRAKILEQGNRWLKKIQKEARKRGGECLSKKWEGWLGSLRFRCGKCGRRWTTQPQNFLNGNWCRSCSLRERHARNRAKRRSPAPT
jgi:hypothetical protein